MTRQEQIQASFPIHDETSAPQGAKPVLERVRAKFGFIPNLLGEFAESPSTLEAYLRVQELLGQGCFSPAEQQVLFLAISATNSCGYCVAAHSTAAQMSGVAADVIDGIRNGTGISDARIEALRRFAQLVVEKRGHVDSQAVTDFLAAGYERAHVLEVILAVAMKTLSNYTNHILKTPLDAPFESHAWGR